MPSTLESHTENDTALFLVALVCPPLAVASIPGIQSGDITTNIFLTLLGWVPGVLEAWYLISNPPSYRSRARSRVLSGRTYTSYSLGKPAALSELEHSRSYKLDSTSSGSRRTRSVRKEYGSSRSSRS